MLSVPEVGRRTYIALMAAVVAAGAFAWATAALVQSRSVGFGWLWPLVIAAVLLPSAAPMVATFTALRRAVTGVPGTLWSTVAFVAGYLGAWAAAGCVAWALAEAAGELSAEHYETAALLALAAGYELTPLKDRCLANCRVPLSFLMASWRDGVTGAFDMGAAYGTRCIGVGALIMATLFAHGAAELMPMAVAAGLIATEKLAPSRTLARRGVAAALLALAAVAAFAPAALSSL